ncbi:DUF1839 family protein [Cupriavidus basilensis]
MHGTPKLGGAAVSVCAAGTRWWSHANCNVDLWIELLHGWELRAHCRAGIYREPGFRGRSVHVIQFPVRRSRAALWCHRARLVRVRQPGGHIAAQTCRGNVVLLDVDSFNLPYAAAAGYRRLHARSCIGVDLLVPEASTAGYYHGDGYHTVSGEEYQAIFRLPAELKDKNIAPYPQARVVRRRFAPPDRCRIGADLA